MEKILKNEKEIYNFRYKIGDILKINISKSEYRIETIIAKKYKRTNYYTKKNLYFSNGRQLSIASYKNLPIRYKYSFDDNDSIDSWSICYYIESINISR